MRQKQIIRFCMIICVSVMIYRMMKKGSCQMVQENIKKIQIKFIKYRL